MNKRHLALVAGVLLVLIVLAAVVTMSRPSPAITIRCSSVAVMGDSVSVTMEISNRMSEVCDFLPARLERFDEGRWSTCFDGIGSFSQKSGPVVGRAAKMACVIKRLPTGTRLRLVVKRIRARQGLNSLPLRVRFWLTGKSTLSLNPFDKTLIFDYRAEVVSEDFVAP